MENGVGDIVSEQIERVPYLKAIELNATSDAILLVGAVSRDYTASKLFNCLLAGRPILAMFHRDSSVAGIAGNFPHVFVADFVAPSDPAFETALAKGIEWLTKAGPVGSAGLAAAIAPWSAEALTRRQCEIFDRV